MAEDVIKVVGETMLVTAGVIVTMKIYGKIQYAKGYAVGYQKGKKSWVVDTTCEES